MGALWLMLLLISLLGIVGLIFFTVTVEKAYGRMILIVLALIVINFLIGIRMIGPRDFETETNLYGGLTYTTRQYYMNYYRRGGITIQSGVISFFGSCRIPQIFPVDYAPSLGETDMKKFKMDVSQNETVVYLEAELITKADLSEIMEAYRAYYEAWDVDDFKEYLNQNEYTNEFLFCRYSFVKDGYEFEIRISPKDKKTEINIEIVKIDKSVASLNE